MQQCEKGCREHGQYGDQPPVGHFEDTNSASGVHRVLEDPFSLGRRKMVKRTEQSPETGEFLWEGAGINRFFPEVNYPVG